MGNTKPEIDELVGAYPVCPQCQGQSVVRDAWAEWSMAKRDWMLKTVFDEFVCDQCGDSIHPVWKLDEKFRQKRIQRLNDEMRAGTFRHGNVILTAGVQALEDKLRAALIDQISRFDAFTADNDPHGEHDFGSIEINGQKFFWKIDYFDLKLERHSVDAANGDVTHRVLTVMLANEY
ncbi:MAG: DUF3768 domain-containing protein [Paracoccaceae bacterium]